MAPADLEYLDALGPPPTLHGFPPPLLLRWAKLKVTPKAAARHERRGWNRLATLAWYPFKARAAEHLTRAKGGAP